MTGKETELDHEGRIATLEEGMRQVCNNHIPHIYEEMKTIKRLLTNVLIGLILAAAGIIADLLLRS